MQSDGSVPEGPLVDSRQVTFTAEVSSNHGQDIDRALTIVDAAAGVGFDAIKFQLFRVSHLYSPEALRRVPEAGARKAWELPWHFIPPLAERARALGLAFACTPFDIPAVEYLAPYVDFLKTASYELLWDDLLRECAQSGLPLVVSTGMATWEEVEHAVDTVLSAGCKDLTLLHCVSAYPAPLPEANLAAIASLRKRTGLNVGWSDHTNEAAVIHRAVHRWGATFVELHFDIDGTGEEYAPGHCWLPSTAETLIRDVRNGIRADGHGRKEPAPSEIRDRGWRADPSDGLRPQREERRKLLDTSSGGVS